MCLGNIMGMRGRGDRIQLGYVFAWDFTGAIGVVVYRRCAFEVVDWIAEFGPVYFGDVWGAGSCKAVFYADVS